MLNGTVHSSFVNRDDETIAKLRPTRMRVCVRACVCVRVRVCERWRGPPLEEMSLLVASSGVDGHQ